MLLLDDLLLAPGKAITSLFEQLARRAQEEWLDDEGVKRELQEIYAMLEAGNISEKDFELRECRLLERLQQIAAAKFQQHWGSTVPAADEAALPPIDVDAAVQVTPLVM